MDQEEEIEEVDSSVTEDTQETEEAMVKKQYLTHAVEQINMLRQDLAKTELKDEEFIRKYGGHSRSELATVESQIAFVENMYLRSMEIVISTQIQKSIIEGKLEEKPFTDYKIFEGKHKSQIDQFNVSEQQFILSLQAKVDKKEATLEVAQKQLYDQKRKEDVLRKLGLSESEIVTFIGLSTAQSEAFNAILDEEMNRLKIFIGQCRSEAVKLVKEKQGQIKASSSAVVAKVT